jgi:hypothetical protein
LAFVLALYFVWFGFGLAWFWLGYCLLGFFLVLVFGLAYGLALSSAWLLFWIGLA